MNKIIKNFINFTEDTIKDEKSKREMMNGIDWISEHYELLETITNLDIYHPGLVHSYAVRKLIYLWPNNDLIYNNLLVSWLCDNKQYPFGMINKIAAYRKIIQFHRLVSEDQLKSFKKILIIANSMKYRPREFLYLDKLLNIVKNNHS